VKTSPCVDTKPFPAIKIDVAVGIKPGLLSVIQVTDV